MSQNKEIQALIRALVAQQFTVEDLPGRTTRRCRVTAPSGAFVIMPGPGQRTHARALLNARAALRRLGADV